MAIMINDGNNSERKKSTNHDNDKTFGVSGQRVKDGQPDGEP